MKAILAITAVLAVLPSVLGHATLQFPAPFGTANSPSKTAPTGGGTSGTPVFPFTGAQYIDWKLIAGDGAGPVRMLINTVNGAFPAATAAPAESATLILVPLTPVTTAACNAGTCATYTGSPTAGPTTPSANPYEFTFNVPAGIACTGSMGQFQNSVCTVQISSSSSWYSGFAFSTAPAVGGATAQAGTVYDGTCQAPDIAALSTCSRIVGNLAATTTTQALIWIPTGTTQAEMDAAVLGEITQNLPNPNVFKINSYGPVQSISNPTPCTLSYAAFLCAQAFVPCKKVNGAPVAQPAIDASGQPCGPTCDEFTCHCALNPIHAYLYSCTTYTNANRDSTGRCPSKPNIRGYGANNATCSLVTNANGVQCAPIDTTCQTTNPDGSLISNAHTTAVSPLLLAVAALASAVAVYFH